MKIFTNKNITQKLVIAIVIVTLFNFCFIPKTVHAAWYGSLFKPMKAFLTTVADIFMTLLNWGVTGDWIYAVDDKNMAEYGDRRD